MSGVYIKRKLLSLLVRTCIVECRHRFVGSSSIFTPLINVQSTRYFTEMNAISFGLLAGCCFSKQAENHDSEPIIPEGIPSKANCSNTSEGLLNRTTEYGSICSNINLRNGENVDHSAQATHLGAEIQSCVSSKTLAADRALCSTDGSVDSKYVVPLGNDNTICAPDEAKVAVPLKRAYGETVDCCKSKYQKFDEEKKELCCESTINVSVVSEKNSANICHDITKSVHPEADATKNEGSSEATKDEAASSKKSKQKPKQRPNYFVSMKISNPVIHKSLEAVQAHIIEQDSRLKPAISSVNKLHITLMVIYLSNAEEHEKALSVLTSLYESLNEDMCKSPLTLEFTGLGTFNDKVLFAKVKPGDSLDRLNGIAEDVMKHFKEASIFSTDKRKFNPHLTVMKLSKAPKLFHQGIKKIDPSLYSIYKDHVFGSEVIKGIELLSMMESDKASGYYKGHQLQFGFAQGHDPAAPSAVLSKEIEDEKRRISQLAQEQIKKMISSSSDKNVSTDNSSHSDVK